MIWRRLVFCACIITTAISCYTLGILHQRRTDGVVSRGYDTKLDAIRAEVRSELGTRRTEAVVPAGTTGRAPRSKELDLAAGARQRMMSEIKQELQSEMGLLPVHLLRDRRQSFVELYADDNYGKTNYGTAGYLGRGYFVTVKHAVVALKDEDNRQGTRKMTSIRVVHNGKNIPARVVDYGDAEVEVDKGDWAIIKTRDLDLPSLNLDTAFSYDFAEPIFRLGNDYSKGIVVSTGYVGQKTGNGLVTALTDGHPGVSGGGVLDQRGDLVGIPIGRMQGDYRFSFILPIRHEMLRKVPGLARTQDGVVLATTIR
jgi:S1-C subfamily serine protease